MLREKSTNKAHLNQLLSVASGIARTYGRIGISDPEDIAQSAIMRFMEQSGYARKPLSYIAIIVKNEVMDLCREYSSKKRYWALPILHSTLLILKRDCTAHSPFPNGHRSLVSLLLTSILRPAKSISSFSSTPTATPSPSLSSPRRICSVPM